VKSNWPSVKESLPKHGVWCFVCNLDNPDGEVDMAALWHDGWFYVYDEHKVAPVTVTHYQIVEWPEPPMLDKRPTIVCLCGSTRFSQAFQEANLRETLAGKIVLSIGCDMRTDSDIFGHLSQDELKEVKRKLDALHLRKIDLADEVLILNVGGYIGESTRNEWEYARGLGKQIRFLEGEHDNAE